MVPLSARLPLYAQIVNTLQQQIEDGTYPPGASLPTELQLAEQFNASRQTVVRGLNMLKQDGWIESQQGRGYFVRSRPASARRGAPDYLDELVEVDESVHTKVLGVEPVMASPRIASALGLREGTPVYVRRRLITSDSGPVALSDAYVPVKIAVDTAVDQPEPVSGSLRRHIEAAGRARFDYVTERITARQPNEAEAELLDMQATDPALWVLVTAYSADDQPLMALDLLMPADRHDLEDSFALAQ